jgi:hypothetical protein
MESVKVGKETENFENIILICPNNQETPHCKPILTY